ncbi:MAG: 6-bladed beta-propeller [Bacteroidia bacterium]|nr:6-bladed beta-propeller [Bacteroidia bacterium]
MKIKLLIICLLFCFLFSCVNEKQNVNKINKDNRINIKIEGNINNLLQIDSIFSDIRTMPLETKEECLITDIVKVLFHQDKMFLQDKAQRLFVFSTNGKFLYEIGKKGKGPGEFLELRDFDIDKDGNIYILDFREILKYTIEGKFSIRFLLPFEKNVIHCNPIQFALKSNGNFLLWGGSAGIKEKTAEDLFVMYEMNNKGKLINRYFPLTNQIEGNFSRFKQYKDIILIDPVFGSNVIYSISNEGIEERYYIDFGGKTLTIPVPEGFKSLSDFKSRIDKNCFHSIRGFIESNDWIYFKFVFERNICNCYFSKKLNKSFISKGWPSVSHRIAPSRILGNYSDTLIAFIDPNIIIEDINNCKKADFNSLPVSEKKNIERLKQIKNTDNPIMFICSLRNY